MAEIRQMRKFAIQGGGSYSPLAQATAPQPTEDESRYCAYNATRERFVSNEIEAGDFSGAVMASRLGQLTSESRTALWLIPYRALSPTSVRVPVDVVTLNKSQVVLEAIESFPLSRGSESAPAAASALVLPANTIASAGIRSGDQLILGTPEQMKGHLRQLENAKTKLPAVIHSINGQQEDAETISKADDAGLRVIDNRRSGADPQATHQSEENTPEQAVTDQEETAPEQSDRAAIAEQAGWNRPKAKKWWQKLASNDPEDPRNATREAMPGLIAYFFTGGQPIPHAIRNISATGAYVLTEERWYRGTVIRITLTDRQMQTSERSITLNAKVMRWGNDGVGLHFLFSTGKRQSKVDFSEGPTQEQFDQFLDRYRKESQAR